jgi:hypothetical protein
VSRDFVLRAAPESALDIDGPLHAALPIASQRWEAIAEAGKAQRSDEAYVRSSALHRLFTAGQSATVLESERPVSRRTASRLVGENNAGKTAGPGTSVAGH